MNKPKNNNIVGEAYISAYRLGEEQAIYPRVIIDPRILTFLNYPSIKDLVDSINNYPTAMKNNTTSILFDWTLVTKTSGIFTQDVPLFIDYLLPCFNNIERIQEIINSVKSNIYIDQKIYSKYRWVVDYLKAIINQKENMTEISEILKVAKKELEKI